MKRTLQPLLLFATAFACWSSAHSAEVVLAKYELPAELTGLPMSIPIVIDVNPAAENVWDVCRIVNGQVEIINQPAESIG